MTPLGRRRSVLLASALLVLLVALAPDPAPALEGEDAAAEAHRIHEEARAHFEAKRFEEALAAFQEARAAYERAGLPSDAAWMCGWMSGCHRAMRRWADARACLRESLRRIREVHGGKDHPDVAESLDNLGQCLDDDGILKEAVPVYQEALEMRRRLFPGDHRHVAMSLNNLGSGLAGLGRFEEALAVHREALEMRRRLFPGDHRLVAISLNNVAGCLRGLGRHAEEVEEFTRAHEMFRRLHPGDGRLVATSLANLASALEAVGRLDEALPRHRAALEMRRRLFPGDHPEVANSLSNLGACLQRVGRFREALDVCREASAMWRGIFPGDHPSTAFYLSNLASCLEDLGRYEQAYRMRAEALAMYRRLFPGDHPDVALALSSLALALKGLGRPAEALACYEASYAMQERLIPGDHPVKTTTLHNLSQCLRTLGRVEESLGPQEKALEMVRRLFGEEHPHAAALMSGLATALSALGRKEEALALHEEAVAIRRRLFPEGHPGLGRSLEGQASLLLDLGRAAEALPHFESALSMLRRFLGDEHRAVAGCLNGLAVCLRSLGRTEEARRCYQEAVDISRRTGDARTHLFLVNLARFLLGEDDDPEGAAALLAEAIAQIEELRSRASGLDEGDRALYFRRLKRFGAYETMARVQLRLGRPGEALRTLERSRARSLLDLLERSRFDPLAEAERRARERGDEELAAEIAEVGTALSESEREIRRRDHSLSVARGRTDLQAEEKKDRIDALREERITARKAQRVVLRRRARIVREHVPLASPRDLPSIQRLLVGGERLLLYSLTERDGLLFLVPPPGGEVRTFPLSWPEGGAIGRASIRAAVDGYRAALVREGRAARGVVPERGSGSPAAGEGHRLFRALVPEKAWAEIRKAPRVLVVPHGALHRLPFEALVVREGETPAKRTYWLDAGPPVCFGTSGSALGWSRDRGDRQAGRRRLSRAVVLGDPIFGREERPVPVPPERGVLITKVGTGSPAAGAGLLPGDVIVAYDGKEVGDRKALGVGTSAASGEVEMRVWRSGEEVAVRIPAGRLGVRVAAKPPRVAMKALDAGDLDRVRERAVRSSLVDRYASLAPLPGTRREVESIRKSLAGKAPGALEVRTLLGEEATKPRLFAEAPSARYLHLATHQLADETEGASWSSLALTLPEEPTAEDDGFLRLTDLLLHWRDRIAGCELVVLSACETRRGRLQVDEGVFAMPWGFMYAGSPSVIASLWLVDDQSTADLMGDFYARLATEETDRLTAFTLARKALRKRLPEPWFWAPFVYIGDPR